METHEILTLLRQRLLPIDHMQGQVDLVEGYLPHARHAAVLVPLFEQDGQIFLTFIRRATTLRSHSGEIAFPGGSVDPGDTSTVMRPFVKLRRRLALIRYVWKSLACSRQFLPLSAIF